MAYNPRQAPVVAPDKGSFPLDHEGQCKDKMKEVMQCLKENQGEAVKCRNLSVAYLKCRMEHGLMAPEPLEGLGFTRETEELLSGKGSNPVAMKPKEKTGFVGGLEAKPVPKEPQGSGK